MEKEELKTQLEKFARWFDKKDHGNYSYAKIVERYIKEGAEDTHICQGSVCECKDDVDKSRPVY